MAVWEAAAAIFLILTKGEPFKLLQAAAAISLKVFFDRSPLGRCLEEFPT
jgi:hypothetical protein